jgi:8-oxo-dGTP diphosphatase
MTDESRISKPVNGQIECPVRVIIINEGKILLCKPIDQEHYFLPGGHVEFGEYADETLQREILEELSVEVTSFKHLGFVDNIYDDKIEGLKRHEVNLLYTAELASLEIKPTEDHITFDWVPLTDFEKTNFLPAGVKKFIVEYIKK